MVKCIGVEKIRGRVRTIWKIGDRAFADYRLKHDVVSRLTTDLSSLPTEIVDRVASLQNQAVEYKRIAAGFQMRLADLIVEDLRRDSSDGVVTARLQNEEKDLFRAVLDRLAEKHPGVFCVVDALDDKVLWAVGVGTADAGSQTQAIAHPNAGDRFSFDRVRSELLPIIDAKGGGRPPIWQGVGTRPEAVDRFFIAFRQMFRAGAEPGNGEGRGSDAESRRQSP